MTLRSKDNHDLMFRPLKFYVATTFFSFFVLFLFIVFATRNEVKVGSSKREGLWVEGTTTGIR